MSLSKYTVLTVEIVEFLLQSFAEDCGISPDALPDYLVDNFRARHPEITIAGRDSLPRPAARPAPKPLSRSSDASGLSSISGPGDHWAALRGPIPEDLEEQQRDAPPTADTVDTVDTVDTGSEYGTPGSSPGSNRLFGGDYWAAWRGVAPEDLGKEFDVSGNTVEMTDSPAGPSNVNAPARGKKRPSDAAAGAAAAKKPRPDAAGAKQPVPAGAAARVPKPQHQRRPVVYFSDVEPDSESVTISDSASDSESTDSQATSSYSETPLNPSPRPDVSPRSRQGRRRLSYVPVIPLPVVNALKNLFDVLPQPPRRGEYLRPRLEQALDGLAVALVPAARPLPAPAAGPLPAPAGPLPAPAAGPLPAPAPGPAPQLRVIIIILLLLFSRRQLGP